MKRNAIARILIFSLLIAILSGILVAGIWQDRFGWGDFSIHIGGTTSGSLHGGTPSDSGSFDAADIDEIVIYWISGDIDILGTDSDTVTYETRNNNSSYETHYKLENRRLSIGFHASSHISTKVKTKDLSLTLPTDWEGKLVKIEAVSADLIVENLSAVEQLKIETVSGKSTVQSVVAAKLDVETVSGDMHFSGEFETIDIESVSAKCTIDAAVACPKSIDMEMVSGNLTVYLPEGYGFDLTLDGVSKTLNTALPYTKDGNHYLSEGTQGNCRIDMDSVSGDIFISACNIETVSPGKLFTVTCADSDTERWLIEPLQSAYPSGYEVRIVTNIVMDADLHLYIDGEFACSYTPQTINDQQYWVFSFIMPEENVTIELKVVGGM